MERETLLVFALLFFVSRNVESTLLFPLWYLFSTFMHELSHYLVALVLGGKPTLPTVLPRRRGGYWVLGEVQLRNPHPYVLLPTGMAPLILTGVAFWVVSHYPQSLLRDVLLFFLLHAGTPSVTDIRTALSSPKGVIFWSIVGAVAYLFSFRLQVSF